MIYHYTHKNKSTWFIQCHKKIVLHLCMSGSKKFFFFWGGVPGGEVLWYFHTYVGSGFLGFKILNFNIFLGFSEKLIYIFLGYEDFVDIFLGSSQNWASLRVISKHFRVFFKVKVQDWDIFGGLLKFQILFWGAWNSWYFLRWTVDAGSEPTYAEKKIEYPPPPPGEGVQLWQRFF